MPEYPFDDSDLSLDEANFLLEHYRHICTHYSATTFTEDVPIFHIWEELIILKHYKEVLPNWNNIEITCHNKKIHLLWQKVHYEIFSKGRSSAEEYQLWGTVQLKEYYDHV